MILFQISSGPGFFTACFTFLNFLSSSTAQADPSEIPGISSSVATHICKQQSAFQESTEIQAPVKAKPEDDDAACGWYSWTKCEDSKSEGNECPSFALEECAEPSVPKTGRKGKGISLQLMPKQPKQQRPDPCKNSTVQGLPDPQIVGKMSKYPSIVSIQRGDLCQARLCTGLILNENWILVQQTGCMYQYDPNHQDLFGVVAGERRLHVEEGTEQKRGIAEYIPHPGLKPKEYHIYKDNIGLVRLSEPLKWNENVQPIDLAAIEALAPSVEKSSLTIVGWLKKQPLKEDEELLASLMESPLDFVPFEECLDDLMQKDNVTKDILICAGQCVVHGDDKRQPSRDVLYAKENEKAAPVPVALGPVRHKNGRPQHGVFTKIATYIPWIKETMESGDGAQGGGQGQTTENPAPGSRIIGGEDAPPHKYPSMVNIVKPRSYVCTYQFCGGVILSEEWILTASHCLDGWEDTNLTVVVGDHDVTDTDGSEQRVLFSKVIQHEGWDWTTGWNDLGVVKVTPPIKFNDKVQPVKLPNGSFDPQGPLMAVGWGSLGNLVSPHILKHVEVPVFPLEECKKLIQSPRPVGDTQICAGDETHGVCNGDSGGPLYHIEESGEQVVVGLTSQRGSLCPFNEPEFYDPDPRGVLPKGDDDDDHETYEPDVYTRVSSFVDWIKKNAELKG